MTDFGTVERAEDAGAGRAAATSAPDVLVNLEAAAGFFNVSVPTFRKWIKEGCPVVQDGDRGVAWHISLRAVKAWRDRRAEEERAEEERRRAALAQLRLELLGDQVEETPAGLTARDRAAEIEAELKAIKLAREKGALVQVDDVRLALAVVFKALSEAIRAIPDRVGAELGLGEDVVGRMVLEVNAALDDAVDVAERALTEVAGHAA